MSCSDSIGNVTEGWPDGWTPVPVYTEEKKKEKVGEERDMEGEDSFQLLRLRESCPRHETLLTKRTNNPLFLKYIGNKKVGS